jgi:hypothetical protein
MAAAIPGTEHLFTDSYSNPLSRSASPTSLLSRSATPAASKNPSLLRRVVDHGPPSVTSLVSKPASHSSGTMDDTGFSGDGEFSLPGGGNIDIPTDSGGGMQSQDEGNDNDENMNNGRNSSNSEGKDDGEKDGEEDEEDSEEDGKENKDNEEEKESEKELTGLDLYMKEKAEAIARRQKMEAALHAEFKDLAVYFKKPSPKKCNRKPKAPPTEPPRRSARTMSDQGSETLVGTAHASSESSPPPDSATIKAPMLQPPWLSDAIKYLTDDSACSDWARLVTQFIQLEERLGYPTGQVCVHSSRSPVMSLNQQPGHQLQAQDCIQT